jgi:hypothetical protein
MLTRLHHRHKQARKDDLIRELLQLWLALQSDLRYH